MIYPEPNRMKLAFLAAVACLVVQGDRTFDLVWKPKLEDKLQYRLVMDLDMSGEAIRFESNVHMRVVKLEANGDYTIETAVRNTTARAGKRSQILPDEKPTAETFNVKGEKVSESKPVDDEVNPMDGILDRITEVGLPGRPVKKNDTWTKDLKGDPKRQIRPATMRYRLIDQERVGRFDAIRVSFSYREVAVRPVEADGSFLLDAKDSSLVGMEANVRNVDFGDELPPGDATLTMRRQ